MSPLDSSSDTTDPRDDRERLVAELLGRIVDGDPDAMVALLPLVYDELHERARAVMAREPREHTLQPTALVHEAFLKLVGTTAADARRESEFLAVASRAMRSVLVDHARRRETAKRGGGVRPLSLDADTPVPESPSPPDVLAVHRALEKLQERDPELAQLVELRYFGGLSFARIAKMTGRSESKVRRSWRVARAFLERELREFGDVE